jgi:hypothetical protein
VPTKGQLCPGEHDREQYRHVTSWRSVPITDNQEVVVVLLSRRGRPRGEGVPDYCSATLDATEASTCLPVLIYLALEMGSVPDAETAK